MHLIKGLKSASSRKTDFLPYCPQSSIFVGPANVARPATTQEVTEPRSTWRGAGVTSHTCTMVSQFILIQITITQCFWNMLYQLQYQSIASCTHCSSTASLPWPYIRFSLAGDIIFCLFCCSPLPQQMVCEKYRGGSRFNLCNGKGASTAACDT